MNSQIPPLTFAYDMSRPCWVPGSTEVEEWRDNRGQPCAHGQFVDGRPWLRMVGIGDFRLDPGGTTIAIPLEGVTDATVIDTYYRSVLPMALQLRGHEVLHASAVVMPQGVLALCAVSETGKSTLAYALSRRGHEIYADDAVAFDASQGYPRLIRLPFALRLRQASAEHFGELAREFVRVTDPGPVVPNQTPQLAAICVLERFGDDRPENRGQADEMTNEAAVVERLSPSVAFAAILAHGYCFSLTDSDRKRRMMQHYLSLARLIPVLRLRFHSGLDHIPETVETLELALHEHCQGSVAANSEDQVREKLTLR